MQEFQAERCVLLPAESGKRAAPQRQPGILLLLPSSHYSLELLLWRRECRIALIYACGGEAQYLHHSPMDGDLSSSVVLHLLIV